MRKIVIELIISVALLLGVWVLLSQVDWMTLFKIEQRTKGTEEKIGDLFWDLLSKSETEINSTLIVAPIDSMLSLICTKNNIDRTKIKFHLLRKDDVNAFALPNNHLVVYTGLINACESESELYGVICQDLPTPVSSLFWLSLKSGYDKYGDLWYTNNISRIEENSYYLRSP